jgi:hypothetical protein
VAKTKKTAEYGDFQTPAGLARAVCSLLAQQGLQPAALIEPTCGIGNFLFAGLDRFKGIGRAIGADINSAYVKEAEAKLRRQGGDNRATLVEADFFATDWNRLIGDLPEPVLILGNLPWVTNAHLSRLDSQNLPAKSNFQNHAGLDAITGKANFDISLWMLIRLLEAMNGRRGTLAMLCKSSVARKTLHYGWQNGIMLKQSAIHAVDAECFFDAAVDAVLLVTQFAPGARDHEATVYPSLSDPSARTVLGFEDGTLLADVSAHHRWKHLCGEGGTKWRSGIKHDCSKVMELRREGGHYRNGLGELVELEEACLYPMLKSSGVANGGRRGSRCMIVTQRAIGEDTAAIQETAPMTWAYLTAHAGLLNHRRSSIYRNRPPFSVFGVGDYSFAPWKVAISGFYKKLEFVVLGPVKGKPVVLDDTSYFLPCRTREQAGYLAAMLNSPVARSFFEAFVFWDGKRPITADLLRRLDLRKLAVELGSEQEFDTYCKEPGRDRSRAEKSAQLGFWA